MNNTKQNIQFNVVASTRDKEAAKYFTSQEFLDKAKDHFLRQIVKNGHTSFSFNGDMAVKSRDQVYIDQTLLKLQIEFPEINHMRVGYGHITLDTKPNTFLRRILPNGSGLVY